MADKHFIFQIIQIQRFIGKTQPAGEKADAFFPCKKGGVNPVQHPDFFRFFRFKKITFAALGKDPGVVSGKLPVNQCHITADGAR